MIAMSIKQHFISGLIVLNFNKTIIKKISWSHPFAMASQMNVTDQVPVPVAVLFEVFQSAVHQMWFLSYSVGAALFTAFAVALVVMLQTCLL